MCMIESIDDGDYSSLSQMTQALRPQYRDRIGKVPSGIEETDAAS
jgi:hypothetical protein